MQKSKKQNPLIVAGVGVLAALSLLLVWGTWREMFEQPEPSPAREAYREYLRVKEVQENIADPAP